MNVAKTRINSYAIWALLNILNGFVETSICLICHSQSEENMLNNTGFATLKPPIPELPSHISHHNK